MRSCAETVKGRAKRTLGKKELGSAWDHHCYHRGPIMGAPSVLESHGSLNLMLVFSIPGAALARPNAISQPRGCASGMAPAREEHQGSPALSKDSTWEQPFPSAYTCPHTVLREQLSSLKTNHPPCRLTALVGHCCHLASRTSRIRGSLEPVYFLTAARPGAGINASLVTHCRCRDICKLSQGFPFFPTGDKIL